MLAVELGMPPIDLLASPPEVLEAMAKYASDKAKKMSKTLEQTKKRRP